MGSSEFDGARAARERAAAMTRDAVHLAEAALDMKEETLDMRLLALLLAFNARHLRAARREHVPQRTHLRPLPLFVPEVYTLHHRLVDVEGYISVDAHRYSVPYGLIGRRLEVRETKDRIEVYEGPRLVASHARAVTRTPTRVVLPEHRPPRGKGPFVRKPPPEVSASV